MFSNGTEYEIFQYNFCDRCARFVHWEEATKDNPVCPIEEGMAQACFDETKFPHEQIREDEQGNKRCTEFVRRRLSNGNPSKVQGSCDSQAAPMLRLFGDFS